MFAVQCNNVVKVIDTTKNTYSCPRGCGPLKYGRDLNFLKKINRCNKCKGIMLTEDEVKKWETGRMGPTKNKNNNLLGLLKSGSNGTLDCPKCSRKMKEITLKYKKTRVMSRNEDMVMDPGKHVLEFTPIIGELIRMVQTTVDLAGDLSQGKIDKSVTIDGCEACFTLWLDKGEIFQVMKNDLKVDSSGVKHSSEVAVANKKKNKKL